MLQAIERRVERPLLNNQRLPGNLLNSQQNTVAVQRSQRDGFQDQQVERPLQQVELLVFLCLRQTASPRRSYYERLGKRNGALLDCQGEFVVRLPESFRP